MTKPKVQISPSIPGYFQPGVGHLDYCQPQVARGDPGISRNTNHRSAKGDVTPLVNQVTTYFPSHLFGCGNSKNVFPETTEDGRRHTLRFLLRELPIAHPHPDQCRTTRQGRLELLSIKGTVKGAITCF